MTFGGVILDHVILGVATATAVTAGGVGLLLRYTRYSFFALTGFVLTYQYRHREMQPVQFWRRRYKLIGLPFLAWSLFYWCYGRYRPGGFDALHDCFDSASAAWGSLKSIVYDLITGSAWYHLYFLSVSMQIYAIFPALLWVLRRTWGFHRYLLVASGAFQAWVMYAMLRPPLPFFTRGVPHEIWTHMVITLIPYQFFVFAGCVAAMHYEAFQAFMVRWRWPIIALGLATIAATLVYYTWDVHRGTSILRAANVFMLHNAFAFIAIIAILYCIGTIWQSRRTKGSVADRFMRTASDRSFAIYLAHALALAELLPVIQNHDDAPLWPLIAVSYVLTCLLTVFIVEVLRRSPISLVTTGRSTIDHREQNPLASGAVAAAAITLGLVLRGVFEAMVGDTIVAFGVLLAISAIVVAVKQRADRESLAIA